MGVILLNNVFSLLAAPLGTGDTAMSVTPADAALFPAPAAGDYAYATISSPGPPDGTNPTVQVEIVKITARVANVMTIVRGQDGSVPAPFPVGAVVALRINAASVEESFISNYDVLLL